MNRKIILFSIAICGLMSSAQAQQVVPAQQEREVYDGPSEKPIQHVLTKSGTAIWGAESVSGTADGQFQNSFVNSTTAGSYDPANWTALTLNDANGVPGNAYWTQTMTGSSQGAYWGTQAPMMSPTQSNGAAIFDSDFMDNAGVAGAFGTGTSPSPHEGWLVSPRIDLTGYTDSVISVKFWCKWREFIVSNFSVSLSTDDGATWTDFSIPAVLPGVSIGEGWVSAYFTNQFTGVVNLTQCRIAFKFEGDYYYAMVDDVTIESGDAVDLTIAPNDINSGFIADQMYQVQIMNNRHIPISGISDPRDFTFGAVVQNQAGGTSNGYENSHLIAEISRDNGGVWTQVLLDSIWIPTINYADPGVSLTDTLSSTNWATVGDYRVRYIVDSYMDFNSSNDTLVEYFSINDDTYASKVEQDINGLPVTEIASFPAGNGFGTYEFGSTYEFPNVGSNNVALDSISQGFLVPANYVGAMDINYSVRLYEWDDANSNTSIDDITELTMVAIGNDTLLGAGNALGTYIVQSTPMFDVNTMTEGYALQDGKIYLATVSLVASENSLTNFSSTNMVWIACAESINYGMNFLNTNTKAHFLHLIDGNGTESLIDQGFGTIRVPAMGLHLSENCLSVTSDLSFSDDYLQVDFTDASTSLGDPVDSWSWDFGDGNTSTMQNPNHTYATGGTYEVCLTVTNTCSSDTYCDSVTVAPNTSGLSENWKENLMVYPNPAESVVNIQNLPEGELILEMRNLLGQVVYRSTIESATQTEISVSRLASGHYNLMIQSKSDVTIKHLVVK